MLSSRDTFLISLLLSLLLLATLIWLSPVTSPSPVARAQSEDACPPLSPPTDPIVDVSTVAQLQIAVNTVIPGTTIRVADGTYHLSGVYLPFESPKNRTHRKRGLPGANYSIVVYFWVTSQRTLTETLNHGDSVQDGSGQSVLSRLCVLGRRG